MKIKDLVKLNIISLFILTGTSFAQTEQPVQVDQTTSEATSTVPAADKDTITSEDDKKIEQSIQSQISQSATLSKLNVNVVSKEGEVTLSGNVDSDSQASSLIEIAQSVIGVKDVDADNLKVKDSKQPFQDMMITAKAKALLMREDIFGTKDVASINLSVETNNGIVYLTGTVDNKDQINNAIKLIQGIKGVKKVEYHVNKVTVNNKNQ